MLVIADSEWWPWQSTCSRSAQGKRNLLRTVRLSCSARVFTWMGRRGQKSVNMPANA